MEKRKNLAFLGVVCFVFKSVILFESVFVFLGGEAYNLFGFGEPWLHLGGKEGRSFLFALRPSPEQKVAAAGGKK